MIGGTTSNFDKGGGTKNLAEDFSVQAEITSPNKFGLLDLNRVLNSLSIHI